MQTDVMIEELIPLELNSHKTRTLADPSEGAAGACPPPPNGIQFFHFPYVFTKKCLHRRLAPPQRLGATAQQEILDPPLKNPDTQKIEPLVLIKDANRTELSGCELSYCTIRLLVGTFLWQVCTVQGV